jgi:uncharacterized membrane protein YqgA involved in biofilm formation
MPERAFFVSFGRKARHNCGVIGAFLNGLGILIGALFGLSRGTPLSRRTQAFFKSGLGAFIVVYGFRLIYDNVSLQPTLAARLKEIAIAVLAVVLGYWLGKALRLQALSNRIGHQAARMLAAAQTDTPGPPAAGFVAATLLFCAAPLGVIGAVADGLQDYFYLLLLKGIMDGLAMMSFVKMFRWPVALAAVPVFFFFNGLALMVQLGARPWLDANGLTGSVLVTAGLMTCSVALVIFEVRRVELANYLPALAVAPLLAHWFG